MSRRYDLVVLGGGTAGLVASTCAAGLGARVALVEQARPGGDCLFTGCIPSKSLLAAAGLAQAMRRADRVGLEPAEPAVDLGRVMGHVKRAIGVAGRPDTPEALRERGVEVIEGRGRFTAPGRIEVDGAGLAWRSAIIATGSRPALPPVPGLTDCDPLTTETIWDLRELPPRLAIIGGGPSGIELGQAFARLGSRVTIVEAGPRLLPGLDPEAGELIGAVLGSEGVRVEVGASIERAERGRLLLGRGEEVEFDRLLAVAGRRATTQELGLENVGVQTGERGFVRADRRLRTRGRRIWAAGDVLGGLQFTHVAGHQGAAAALNALLRLRRSYSARGIPRVVFTDPELAAVGLGAEEARAQLGHDPVLLRHAYAASDRAITEGRTQGFATLVCDGKGHLLGALVAAPASAENAAQLGALVRRRAKVGDLAQTVHPYPTYAEGPARAAEEWFWRSYLTPRNRRLLRPLLLALRALER